MSEKPSDPNPRSLPEKSTPSPSALSSNQHPPTPIALISGPTDADPAYFETHYLPPIQKAILSGHRFILGPSPGVAALALKYLRNSGVAPSRIRLYLNTSEETRLKPVFRRFEESGGSVVMVKGGLRERDEAMMRESHYDIERWRREEEEEGRAGLGEAGRRSAGAGAVEANCARRKSGVGLMLPKSQ